MTKINKSEKMTRTKKAISDIIEHFKIFSPTLLEQGKVDDMIDIKIKNIVKFNKEKNIDADLKITFKLGKFRKKLTPKLLVHKVTLTNKYTRYKELDPISLPATTIENGVVTFDIPKSGYLDPEYMGKTKSNKTVLCYLVYKPFSDTNDAIILHNKVVSEILDKSNVIKEEETIDSTVETQPTEIEQPVETIEKPIIPIDSNTIDKISFDNIPEQPKPDSEVTIVEKTEYKSTNSNLVRNIIICIATCALAFGAGVLIKGMI